MQVLTDKVYKFLIKLKNILNISCSPLCCIKNTFSFKVVYCPPFISMGALIGVSQIRRIYFRKNRMFFYESLHDSVQKCRTLLYVRKGLQSSVNPKTKDYSCLCIEYIFYSLAAISTCMGVLVFPANNKYL